jgi:predicted nucleotidyltransferase/plasmid stability protein
MPVSFSVKNIPDRVAKTLRARAARNHRSLQGELLAILTAATQQASTAPSREGAGPTASAPPVDPNAEYGRRMTASAEVRETAEPSGDGPSVQKSNEFGRQLAAPAIAIPNNAIVDFCRRWRITEFALFGSVLRDDFRPESDIDVMVRFERDAPWSLFDIGDMQAELSDIFHRKVDLHEREGVEESKNWIRRKHILENHRVIYAA